MKKLLLVAVPVLALSLAACGNSDDDKKEKEQSTEQKAQNESTNESTDSSVEETDDQTVLDDPNLKQETPFRDFSLEVNYPKGEYSIEYELEMNGEEAEIEDEREQKKVVGADALNEVKPLLKKLTFDQKTSDEDVKKQILSILPIDEDYTNIELEVDFHDHVEKKYIFTK